MIPVLPTWGGVWLRLHRREKHGVMLATPVLRVSLWFYAFALIAAAEFNCEADDFDR